VKIPLSKYTIIGIISLMVLSSLLSGCRISPATKFDTQTLIPETQVFNSGSYITATSIRELTNRSKIVVVGKAVKTGNIINLAREIDDISKPDPNLFGIGQIYEFEVSRYLKSEKDVSQAGRVNVVQFEGMLGISPQETLTMRDIEKARSQERYIPITLGSEYILFLEPLIGFPELEMHYTGVAHPWRFALVSGCAVPDSPWQGASLYYHPQPVEDFIKQVEGSPLVDDKLSEPSAYPPPGDGTVSVCPSESAKTNPYP